MTNEEIKKLFEMAPDGATHYTPKGIGVYAAFWRKHCGKWTDAWVIEGPAGSIVRYQDPSSPTFESLAVERPTTQSWSGEGLPPVGTVCEYRSGYVEQPFEYAQCEIIAHFEGERGKNLAAFKYTAHDGVVQLGRGMPQLFRPIRTPEPIAAMERELAAMALFKMIEGEWDWPSCHSDHKEKYYRAIDAGWGKP